MPKFKTEQEAHDRHTMYNIDTDEEGKYNINAIVLPGKYRLMYILDAIPSESYVLEIGCNSGGLCRLIKTEKQCFVKGIDISPCMVKKAIEKGISAQLAKAEDLPFKDNTFETIIMSEVLEHIYDPIKALHEAKRVLKPKGRFIGTVPHNKSFNSTRKSIDDHDWHTRIYSWNSLEETLSQVFKIKDQTLIPWYGDPLARPQWIGFICEKEQV